MDLSWTQPFKRQSLKVSSDWTNPFKRRNDDDSWRTPFAATASKSTTPQSWQFPFATPAVAAAKRPRQPVDISWTQPFASSPQKKPRLGSDGGVGGSGGIGGVGGVGGSGGLSGKGSFIFSLQQSSMQLVQKDPGQVLAHLSDFAVNGQSAERIKRVLTTPCPPNRCSLQCHKRVPLQTLTQLCRAFWSVGAAEQEYVLFAIASMQPPDTRQRHYAIEGVRVCHAAFVRFLGLGGHRFGKAIKGEVDLRKSIDKERPRLGKPDSQASLVSRFFSELYQSSAEGLPDGSLHNANWAEEHKNIEQLANAMGQFDDLNPGVWQRLWFDVAGLPVRHMPPGQIHDVFLQYLAWHDEHANLQSPPASWSTFWRCWIGSWDKVLKFRMKSQHSRCDICHKYEQLIHGERGDVGKKIDWARQLRAHLRDQYADRALYWGMRWASKMHMPVLVIIIDSMDKSKFAVPRFNYHKIPKWLETLHRPKLVVTAGYAHGWCTKVWIAEDRLNHGADAFLDVLMRILEGVSEISHKTGKPMPRHLWIQSDNTTSQAKNEEKFQMMSWLIGKRKFDSISLNFLPVGHTHEDIDQFFALMCGVLSRQRIWEDPTEVATVLRNGLASHVAHRNEEFNVECLASIRHFKPWLAAMKVMPYNTFLPRGGQDSARSFTFKLGMDLSASEAEMLKTRALIHGVYCCVKGAMHHLALNGPPVLCVTPERLGWV